MTEHVLVEQINDRHYVGLGGLEQFVGLGSWTGGAFVCIARRAGIHDADLNYKNFK